MNPPASHHAPVTQPPVMALIRERRKHAHLSYDRAGLLAGISGTRWRQLEEGRRAIAGIGHIPEHAPAITLARMAWVVGLTPDDLAGFGLDEAAGELKRLAEAAAREDGETAAEAARMAALIPDLTDRQRAALEDKIAAGLRAVRKDGLAGPGTA